MTPTKITLVELQESECPSCVSLRNQVGEREAKLLSLSLKISSLEAQLHKHESEARASSTAIEIAVSQLSGVSPLPRGDLSLDSPLARLLYLSHSISSSPSSSSPSPSSSSSSSSLSLAPQDDPSSKERPPKAALSPLLSPRRKRRSSASSSPSSSRSKSLLRSSRSTRKTRDRRYSLRSKQELSSSPVVSPKPRRLSKSEELPSVVQGGVHDFDWLASHRGEGRFTSSELVGILSGHLLCSICSERFQLLQAPFRCGSCSSIVCGKCSLSLGGLSLYLKWQTYSCCSACWPEAWLRANAVVPLDFPQHVEVWAHEKGLAHKYFSLAREDRKHPLEEEGLTLEDLEGLKCPVCARSLSCTRDCSRCAECSSIVCGRSCSQDYLVPLERDSGQTTTPKVICSDCLPLVRKRLDGKPLVTAKGYIDRGSIARRMSPLTLPSVHSVPVTHPTIQSLEELDVI